MTLSLNAIVFLLETSFLMSCITQDTINASTKEIAVRDIQVVSKDSTSVLKDNEDDKMKTYIAMCWSRDTLSDDRLASLDKLSDIELHQKTPIRVLHRRTLATRLRTVYRVSAQRFSADPSQNHYFVIRLSTQAGTYVKEFVHGDLGRTEPSLGTLLGTECDILALDVLNVELDWPPSWSCNNTTTNNTSNAVIVSNTTEACKDSMVTIN